MNTTIDTQFYLIDVKLGAVWGCYRPQFILCQPFYFSCFTAAFIVIGCPSQTKGLKSSSCRWRLEKLLTWGFWAAAALGHTQKHLDWAQGAEQVIY